MFGGKGGVGTTTVAVNLATSLMEMDGVQTVALVDTNAPFGDIPLFLNIEPPIFDWMEVSKNLNRLDSTYLMSILYGAFRLGYMCCPPLRHRWMTPTSPGHGHAHGADAHHVRFHRGGQRAGRPTRHHGQS